MTRTAKVTEKSTKGEILDAYREILAQASVGESTLSAEENSILASASKETVEKITKDLTQLKLSLTQTISDLTDRLTQEAERFTTIKKAITLAQNELEELNQIKVRAGMLKRMVELQQQKEKEFNEEQKAFEEERKRARARDEEEYGYQQELLKKRDTDDRQEENSAFERAIASRKEEYAKQLKELEELRKKTAQFPSELEKAIKEAVAAAVGKEKETADVSARLAKQQADSDFKLAQAKIESLQDMVKSQTLEIARLNRELSQATSQVKDIAIAVAEGQRREPPLPSGKSPI